MTPKGKIAIRKIQVDETSTSETEIIPPAIPPVPQNVPTYAVSMGAWGFVGYSLLMLVIGGAIGYVLAVISIIAGGNP